MNPLQIFSYKRNLIKSQEKGNEFQYLTANVFASRDFRKFFTNTKH
jgi:hypothetical protein